MHKAFPLLVRKFPLPEGTSYCLKKNATARRKVMPLPEDCTAVIVKKKPSVKDDGFLKISALCLTLYSRRKFEQWQFWMQQYLQHEHYTLWEVIEFGDSFEALENNPSTTTTSTTSGEKSERTITLTTEDMLKKKNDVKARTTLLDNEATKKTKKNLLKQQYGNFRAEGSETLEQTFTRPQVIVGQLQFMGVEVKQDDLNQKFLTSLAPEWLMHTIVWRN
nr:hypothetical protein [Tanacetum cinerariifolium]